MGFKDVQSGDGFTKFDKGTNLLIKPDEISPDKDQYQGKEYYQLVFTFDAVPENGGERGNVPAWLTSKITIQESDEHTSNLGKLLIAAGILDEVLQELGADEALVQAIKEGEQRYEVENEDENAAMLEAVAKHLGGVVIRAGSKWNGSDDYSVVSDFYENVEDDPFEESDDFQSSETAIMD